MKNFSDTIGNRTRDLPACNSVPQTNALPLASHISTYLLISISLHPIVLLGAHIVTFLRSEQSGVRVPVEAKDISFLQIVETGSEYHSLGTGVRFRRDPSRLPPSSSKFKNRQSYTSALL
jgi:hypothetical protein